MKLILLKIISKINSFWLINSEFMKLSRAWNTFRISPYNHADVTAYGIIKVNPHDLKNHPSLYAAARSFVKLFGFCLYSHHKCFTILNVGTRRMRFSHIDDVATSRQNNATAENTIGGFQYMKRWKKYCLIYITHHELHHWKYFSVSIKRDNQFWNFTFTFCNYFNVLIFVCACNRLERFAIKGYFLIFCQICIKYFSFFYTRFVVWKVTFLQYNSK